MATKEEALRQWSLCIFELALLDHCKKQGIKSEDYVLADAANSLGRSLAERCFEAKQTFLELARGSGADLLRRLEELEDRKKLAAAGEDYDLAAALKARQDCLDKSSDQIATRFATCLLADMGAEVLALSLSPEVVDCAEVAASRSGRAFAALLEAVAETLETLAAKTWSEVAAAAVPSASRTTKQNYSSFGAEENEVVAELNDVADSCRSQQLALPVEPIELLDQDAAGADEGVGGDLPSQEQLLTKALLKQHKYTAKAKNKAKGDPPSNPSDVQQHEAGRVPQEVTSTQWQPPSPVERNIQVDRARRFTEATQGQPHVEQARRFTEAVAEPPRKAKPWHRDMGPGQREASPPVDRQTQVEQLPPGGRMSKGQHYETGTRAQRNTPAQREPSSSVERRKKVETTPRGRRLSPIRRTWQGNSARESFPSHAARSRSREDSKPPVRSKPVAHAARSRSREDSKPPGNWAKPVQAIGTSDEEPAARNDKAKQKEKEKKAQTVKKDVKKKDKKDKKDKKGKKDKKKKDKKKKKKGENKKTDKKANTDKKKKRKGQLTSSSSSSSSSSSTSLCPKDFAKSVDKQQKAASDFVQAATRGDLVRAEHIVFKRGVKWTSEAGDGPLHLAAKVGQLRLAGFVLRQPGAFKLLDARNRLGETPLLVATRKFRGKIALLLLEALADPTATDKAGESPELLDLNGLVQETEADEALNKNKAERELLAAVIAKREEREEAMWRERWIYELGEVDFTHMETHADLERMDTGRDWMSDVAEEAATSAQRRRQEELAAALMAARRKADERDLTARKAPKFEKHNEQSQQQRSSSSAGPSGKSSRQQEAPAPPAEQKEEDEETRINKRAADDTRWRDFEERARQTAATLGMRDVPWPSGPKDNPLRVDPKAHPAMIRSQLRAGLLRWHPDKFEQRFGSLLPTSGAARSDVLNRVKEVAQHLNNLMNTLLPGNKT
eukprot:TRINITY_DN18302_c0_g1_i1.p1 TRINITY_DN18302_c0_g1~~TRINITY_DN18302_c0_g1_i1.p1  ORF type:complete len:958 (-),score=254.78 TRINITY_DN18302_c0_g1_i1:110-2983(-)